MKSEDVYFIYFILFYFVLKNEEAAHPPSAHTEQPFGLVHLGPALFTPVTAYFAMVTIFEQRWS
jgi:hypothetical protein